MAYSLIVTFPIFTSDTGRSPAVFEVAIALMTSSPSVTRPKIVAWRQRIIDVHDEELRTVRATRVGHRHRARFIAALVHLDEDRSVVESAAPKLKIRRVHSVRSPPESRSR